MTRTDALSNLAVLTGEIVQTVTSAAAGTLTAMAQDGPALATHPAETPAQTEARLRAEAARFEESFDNLPL